MRPLLTLGLLALLASAPATTGALRSGRFSFDELRISLGYGLSGDASHVRYVDSPPGSFARDYRWAVTRTGDQDHRDADHEFIAYYGGWTRVETFKPSWPAIQFANKRQRIVVMAQSDSHTYRKYIGEDAAGWLSPKEPPPTPEPKNAYSGSETVEYTTTYSPLSPMVFDGLAAQGRRIVLSIRTISGTGTCKVSKKHADEYLMEVTDEYRASAPEPPEPFLALPHDDVRMISSCRTVTVNSPEPPTQKSFDQRFLLYSRETDYAVANGKARRDFINIVERGRIRNLLPRNWQALQLPGYYTDSCSIRPVPFDCRPRPSYARLPSQIVARTRYTNNIWSIIKAAGGDALPADAGRLGLASDGTLWSAHEASARVRSVGVGYIATDGSYHEVFRFSASAEISDLVVTPKNSLLFAVADGKNDNLVERRADGTIVKRALKGLSLPSGLALDDQSNVWLSDFANDSILKIAPNGKVRTFQLPKDDNPFSLFFDGKRLWFAGGTSAGYIDAADVLHRFAIPRTDDEASGNLIGLPGDRVLYPAENRLEVVSLNGTFRGIQVAGHPDFLLLDSHGILWYNDHDAGSLRVIPDFVRLLDATQSSAS